MTTTGRVLLVLDYPGRRDESRISNLGLESDGWDVRYLLEAPHERELTSAEYAARLTHRYGLFGSDVAAVLAYCMAAPIAQEIAASLGTPLILFDGEPSTAEAVERELGVAMTQLGGARKVPDPPTEAQLRSEPAECVERMRQILVRLGAGALREDGADEQEAAIHAGQVAGFYLDWLVYLVAAHNTSWPAWGGTVFHVVSRGHTFTRDWPGAEAMQLRYVDSGRNELLNHPDTNRLVREFLAHVPESV